MNKIIAPHDSIQARFVTAVVSLCEILDSQNLHDLPEDLRLSFVLSRIMYGENIDEILEDDLKCAADHLGNIVLSIGKKSGLEVRINICKDYEIQSLENGDFRIYFALPRQSIQIIQEQIFDDPKPTQVDDSGELG